MFRQPIAFEWQVGDDIEWQEQGLAESGTSVTTRRSETQLAIRLLRTLLFCCVALCTAGSIAIPEIRLAQEQAEKAVRFALLQEKLLQAAGSRHGYGALLDREATRQWQSQWQTVWEHGMSATAAPQVTLLTATRQGNLVVATVLMHDPAPDWGENSNYREHRYYRLHGQSWLRTIPQPSFWGELQQTETAYFQLGYYAPDAPAMQAASRKLDGINTNLYARLGMAVPQQRTKQTFSALPEFINSWRSYDNRVEFTSPTLAPIPIPLTDEEYILHLITNRLAYFAIQEAMARTRTGTEYRWNLMLWGVRSWLLQDLLGQSSPWSLEAAAALRSELAARPQISLEMLNRGYISEQPNETELMARYLLAESVVTYAMATYGADRLPILLQDFSVYSRWKDLVPRAFGVPLEEFETGWRGYVGKRYGS